ncbi:NmrA family NAD(P)-binding protein [Actinomadura rugatobispora]|uniref:NmrA family NAD(P)-binding protein n=1 Tax=Actinomadura rugatobispora TaxID=1994 RepID=A0ABW0ZZT6_9ACTN|nr:NAD(P)H-binding protein [Actinomadura rugatobispora]
MTILVTGATGNVGRHVVEELLSGGHRVRALTRAPAGAGLPHGVEVATGDLAVVDSLAPALEGVTAVHLITFDAGDGAALRTGPQIARLATKAGVGHVTMLWSGEPGPVEEAVAAEGLPWTTLQPQEFMSNALLWTGSVRAEGVVREPFGATHSAMIHEADIGAVAARTLTEDGHVGKEYVLTGPEVLDMPQKLAVLGEALGRDLRFVELTEQQARERMRRAGASQEAIDHVIGWYADPPKEAYTVTDTVERILGRPARTFAQWARENAEAFR